MYSSNAQPTGTNRPKACHPPHTHTHNTGCCGNRGRVPGTNTHVTVKPQHSRPQPHHPTHPHTRGPGTYGVTHHTYKPTPPTTNGGVHKVTAAIATGKHPEPSRTRKLSLPAPMVLRPTGRGRVGRRRTYITRRGPRSCAAPSAVSDVEQPDWRSVG